MKLISEHSIRSGALAIATLFTLHLPAVASGCTVTEIVDVAGDGTTRFLPQDIALDRAGNAYISSLFFGDNVFRVTPDNVVSRIIDEAGDGVGNVLDLVRDVVVDLNGNVYVAGYGSDNVFRVSPDGTITEIIDATGDGDGRVLDGPTGLAVAADGTVYVSGHWSDNVFEISIAGEIREIVDGSGDGIGHALDAARQVAVGPDGNVYVSGFASHNAFRIAPDGTIDQIIDSTGDGAGAVLSFPANIAVGSDGLVYLVGERSDNVFEITPDGAITTIIDASIGTFDRPIAVAVALDGEVYIAASASNNVFRISQDGDIREIIDATGDGRGNPLRGPNSVAVDADGTVYVTGFESRNALRISRESIDPFLNPIDWITVGDPGNACDEQPQGCIGTVDERYRISPVEVTNAEYAEFLNAVAATDTNGLYYTGPDSAFFYGGIRRLGAPGQHHYCAIAGRESRPVINASFWDATRYANWLHNGMPYGEQDETTTEDGAYSLGLGAISINSVTRNENAEVFIPSDDEWYKAAYYDPASVSYFDYPTSSNTSPTCSPPGATPNTANCGLASDPRITEVGNYTASASPVGTFNQAGNAREWTEARPNATERAIRGSWYGGASETSAASIRVSTTPSRKHYTTGFRIASAAELEVEIDVKPRAKNNVVNLQGRAALRVAILGSAEFDVRDIDVTTLALGPDGASVLHRRDEHFRDINRDGFADVVSRYRVHQAGIAPGDIEICLVGETFEGRRFQGCDLISTVPNCGLGFELVLIIPCIVGLRERARGTRARLH